MHTIDDPIDAPAFAADLAAPDDQLATPQLRATVRGGTARSATADSGTRWLRPATGRHVRAASPDPAIDRSHCGPRIRRVRPAQSDDGGMSIRLDPRRLASLKLLAAEAGIGPARW